MLYLKLKELVRTQDSYYLQVRLNKVSQSTKDILMVYNFINPKIVLLLSIFGGQCGADRLYLKDTALGIIKLLLFSVSILMLNILVAMNVDDESTWWWLALLLFFAWFVFYVVDIFICYAKAKDKNLKSINEIIAMNE